MMDAVPELRFDSSSHMNAKKRRVLATLKFRLAMHIGYLDGVFYSSSLLPKKNRNENAIKFLRDFKAAASYPYKMAALLICINSFKNELKLFDSSGLSASWYVSFNSSITSKMGIIFNHQK